MIDRVERIKNRMVGLEMNNNKDEREIRNALFFNPDNNDRYHQAIKLAERFYTGKYVTDVLDILGELDRDMTITREVRMRAIKAGENYCGG